MSKDDRAARTAALREAQARADRQRRLTVIGAVVAVLVVIVGVGFWVQSTRDTTGDAPAATPSGTADYSIFVGDEAAPTTITVYEDLQCPACRDFEQATGDQVATGIESGDVRVEYRLVSFLDGASGNEYSSRALNALLVTLDTAGVDAFKSLHDALYADQPAEGGDGPEDDALIRAAVAAGADESAVTGPIEDKMYEQWIKNATEAMSTNGVQGTPTVFVNGQRVEDAVDAVLAAVG